MGTKQVLKNIGNIMMGAEDPKFPFSRQVTVHFVSSFDSVALDGDVMDWFDTTSIPNVDDKLSWVNEKEDILFGEVTAVHHICSSWGGVQFIRTSVTCEILTSHRK